MLLSPFKVFLILGTLINHINAGDFTVKENVNPTDLDLRNISQIYLKNITINIIPKNYFKDLNSDPNKISKIRIENSLIDKIDVEAFDGLNHLNALDLINDGIQSIDPETFSHLKGLEILNLDSNNLTILSLNLLKIQELVLSNNSIEILTEDFLKGRNIKTLDLSKNIIKYLNISFAPLEALERLYLSYNYIEKIENFVFENNTKLAYLDVSGNILSSTDGLRLSSLVSLDLSNNTFVSLNSAMFEGMINLEYLTIKENVIKKLNDPFIYLNNLQELDLSYNQLETIDANLFEKNYRLEKINLMGNNIKILNSLTMELKSLHYFDASNNLITQIDKDFFKSMSRVATLDLSYNQLTNVDGLFDPLTKLNKLNLAVNNISLIQPFTLKNEDLRSINLSSNGLDLDFGYFKNNKRISHIDLSNNRIKDFCVEKPDFDDLIDIDLSDNLMKDIKCFMHGKFDKLEAVDIGKNKLTCNSDFDDTIHWFVVHSIFPSISKDDDIIKQNEMITSEAKMTSNETLSVWNKVKREICPDGFDINIERSEGLKESMEDSDSSDSNENASQVIEEETPVNKAKSDDEEMEANTEKLNEEILITEEIPSELLDPTAEPLPVKKLELNVQSQRGSWDAFAEDESVNDDAEMIEQIDIKRSGYTWYTIALVLIGISLTLVCINVAGFMYIRSRSSSKRGGTKCAQTYTQLNNDVYRDTTEPARPQINNNLFSPNRTNNKIFLSDQIQELLLNFGLFKKGEEDSESIKKMIVNTTSNSGLQQV